ncbi:hypothetical protein IX329_000735 [Fusobacterium necrophorum]|nr:hypothetical protein [Fusobacterium necrophorum]MBR8733162.1 hypothetical protein [Fusobacterium necrophorum]MBR8789294.1 hypothetical protein [Fusobacterium necrophorum]
MDPIKERIALEKNLMLRVVREKKNKTRMKLYSLSRTNSGRILSFSAYELDCRSNIVIDREVRWKYSNLSKEIHSLEKDERNILAEEIKKFIPFDDVLEHEAFKEIQKSFVHCMCFCKERNLSFLSKQKYNYVCRLIKKWQTLSQQIHYKPSKAEKRKLKKLLVK